MKKKKIEKPATWVLPRPDFDAEFLKESLTYVIASRAASDESWNRAYAALLESNDISVGQVEMFQQGIAEGRLAMPKAKWRRRLQEEGLPDKFELHSAISDVIGAADYCKEGKLFDEAVLLLEFAAQICLESRHHPPGSDSWLLKASHALLLLGMTFEKSEQHAKAQQTWLRALGLPKLLDDSEFAPVARNSFEHSRPLWLSKLGDSLAAQGLYLESEKYFAQAIESFHQWGYADDPTNQLLAAEIHMFQMYIKANRAADGELVLQRAKERVAQSVDKYKLIWVLGVEAQYKLDIDQSEEAERSFLQAIELADSLPPTERYSAPRLELSELYSRLGRTEDAADSAAHWLRDFDVMKKEEADHCGPDRLSNEAALKSYKRVQAFLSLAGEKYRCAAEELLIRIEQLELLLADLEHG